MNEQKMTEKQRKEMLLVAIYFFSQFGRRDEVSHSELVDCITEFQKKFPLGYEFGEKLSYVSFELSEDLNDLCLQGYIKHYKYGRRDIPLFPKNFIALWSLGRGYAKKIVKTMSPEIIEALHKAVETAIEKYKKRWGTSVR